MARPIADRAAHNLVIALQARARLRRLQPAYRRQIVVPDGEDGFRDAARWPALVRLRHRLHCARLPACLYRHFPYLIGPKGNNIHISAKFARNTPVLVAPQVGKLADTMLLNAGRLARSGSCLRLLPVVARFIYNALDTLLRLAGALQDYTLDLFDTLIYIILIGLLPAIAGIALVFVTHSLVPLF